MQQPFDPFTSLLGAASSGPPPVQVTQQLPSYPPTQPSTFLTQFPPQASLGPATIPTGQITPLGVPISGIQPQAPGYPPIQTQAPVYPPFQQQFTPVGSQQPAPFLPTAPQVPQVPTVAPSIIPPGANPLVRPGQLTPGTQPSPNPLAQRGSQYAAPKPLIGIQDLIAQSLGGRYTQTARPQANVNPSRDVFNYPGGLAAAPEEEPSDPADATLIDLIPYAEIASIKYSMYTYEVLDNMNAIVIHSDADFGRGTLFDDRLGVDNPLGFVDSKGSVTTGRPGMIVFERPIYHPSLIKTIAQVLKSICPYHSSLLLGVDYLKRRLGSISDANRLSYVAELSSKVVFQEGGRGRRGEEFVLTSCPGSMTNPNQINLGVRARNACGCVAIDIMVTNSVESGEIKFIHRSERNKGEAVKRILQIEHVEIILRRLAQDREAMKILGFNDNYGALAGILRALYVIPPIFRPPHVSDGHKSDHALTKLYKEIIRANNRFNRGESPDRKSIYNAVNKLLIQKREDSLRRGQGDTSIKELLPRKEGYFQRYSEGKRVNFSARSVIVPGADIDYGWIGIPVALRKDLLKVEYVAPFNIKRLQNDLRRGEIISVIHNPGTIYERRRGVRRNTRLEIGQKVERFLQDGDLVAANRQPTLHLQGLLVHEAKIVPDQAIEPPLPVTTGYNADFDGDEMTLTVSQGPFAEAEAKVLMAAWENIIAHQTNSPIAGPVYDAVVGVTKLTQPHSLVDPVTFWNCLNSVPDLPEQFFERVREAGISLLTGHALFSVLLPADFNVKYKDATIVNGILIKGTLTKKHLGASAGSIVHQLLELYGVVRAKRFITEATSLFNMYLKFYPLSVGLGDCFFRGSRLVEETEEIEPTTGERIVKRVWGSRQELYLQRIRDLYRKAAMVIRDMGIAAENPAEKDHIENLILLKIQDFQKSIQSLTRRFLDEEPGNPLRLIIESGSKGSIVNYTQIAGMAGQQLIANARIRPDPKRGEQRCPPFFLAENESSLEAYGMCKSSFVKGLTPIEFFFHQASGREGLLDTGLRTVEAGTLTKRVGVLKDFTADTDASVRNPQGTIFSFLYGEDGLLPGLQAHWGRSTYGSFINLDWEITKLNAEAGYPPGSY